MDLVKSKSITLKLSVVSTVLLDLSPLEVFSSYIVVVKRN